MMANGNGNTDAKYRGLGHNVRGLELADALRTAGLDWKTVQLPMLIQGKTETRPSAFKSLVRSDNGVELGISTPDYKPVHNYQLVGTMMEAAGAASVQLEQAGCLDEGRRVWALGTVPGVKFSLPVGKDWEDRMQREHGGSTSWVKEDTTVLKVQMGAGHVPGMAITIEFIAERLICTNGAKITAAVGRFRMTHSGHWSQAQVAKIKALLVDAGVGFEQYELQAEQLRKTEITRAEGELWAIQLLQPRLLDEIVDRGGLDAAIRDDQGRFHLPELMEAAIRRGPRVLDPEQYNRPVKRVLELVDAQPGAEMARGTLWNQYNALTYFVDHERGRNADSGLNSAMFGEGAQLKQNALELAMDYSGLLRTAN